MTRKKTRRNFLITSAAITGSVLGFAALRHAGKAITIIEAAIALVSLRVSQKASA